MSKKDQPTTNRSSARDGEQDENQPPEDGPPIRTRPMKTNRGRAAPSEGSGVVAGSGAAAGGTGGVEEDYDDDPVGGGGPNVMPTPHKGK